MTPKHAAKRHTGKKKTKKSKKMIPVGKKMLLNRNELNQKTCCYYMISTCYYPSVTIDLKVHHKRAPSRYSRNTLTQHTNVLRLSAPPPVDVKEPAEVSHSRLSRRCLFYCRFALHLPPEAPKVFQESIRKKKKKERKKGRKGRRRTAARHKSARLTNVVQPLCKETVMASDCCRGGRGGKKKKNAAGVNFY